VKAIQELLIWLLDNLVDVKSMQKSKIPKMLESDQKKTWVF